MAKSAWIAQAFGDYGKVSHSKTAGGCRARVEPNLYDGLPWRWYVDDPLYRVAKGEADDVATAKRKAAAALRACGRRSR